MIDLRALPTDRVVQVRGANADELAAALTQGPPDLPAPLICRFLPASTQAQFVGHVLDDLESAAIGLFPFWLPGGEDIATAAGAGLATVRALATVHSGQTNSYGPFLGDLACAALSGHAAARRQYPTETRAIGLSRVVTEALHRNRLILLSDIPPGLSSTAETVLAAGYSWLAEHGRLGVWLAGEGLPSVDWIASDVVSVSVKSPISRPVVVGAPHPRSEAEAALEKALAAQPWAVGREWNRTYQPHPLRNPIRVDLMWPDERCIVEIDGLEHCEPVKFDADRRRDVQLQLDGFAVLRFTNSRVLHDVWSVVSQIGQLVKTRRNQIGEGKHG